MVLEERSVMDIEVIYPRDIPKPLMAYTPIVKAGSWVFPAGQHASDFQFGRTLPADAEIPKGHPYSASRLRLQTAALFRNLDRTAKAAGTSLDNLVRIDQFFTPEALHSGSTFPTITEYLNERDQWINPPMPASTSHPIEKLLVNDTLVEVDWIAIVPGGEMRKSGVETKDTNPLAGYSRAVKAGQYVFVAGMPASDWKTGLAAPARRNEAYWCGMDIKLQTAYILDELGVVLNQAGTSLGNVVHAAVYLTDIRDTWGMDEIWKKYFPRDPPARSIVPWSLEPQGIPGSVIEITATAIIPNKEVRKEVIQTDAVPKQALHQSQAIKAGDLLWLGGMMAADESGIAAEACILGRLDPADYPYYSTSPKRQVDVIMKNTKALCEAAGASLGNVVKRTCYHTDFEHDFVGAIDAYFSYFQKGRGPASTTIEVKPPLAVPDCRLLIDQIAYVGSK
jgi:enamine deaminase RidA (YjgF/YER057c/UK114 family)